MVKRFYSRKDAEDFYREKIEKMLQVLEGQEPVDFETLKSMYNQNNDDYTKLMVESMEYRKKMKNSTILKRHFRNKYLALQEQINQICESCEVLDTAVLLCEALKLKSTSSFNKTLLSEETLAKVIDYKIEEEKAQNAEAEKEGRKKSHRFSNLYEEFDESQYPIFENFK